MRVGWLALRKARPTRLRALCVTFTLVVVTPVCMVQPRGNIPHDCSQPLSFFERDANKALFRNWAKSRAHSSPIFGDLHDAITAMSYTRRVCRPKTGEQRLGTAQAVVRGGGVCRWKMVSKRITLWSSWIFSSYILEVKNRSRSSGTGMAAKKKLDCKFSLPITDARVS